MTNISNNLIIKLSSGPSEATEADLRATRDNIVRLLGSEYEIFLQGSYKNDTAISNINDIDIVAVRTTNVPRYWEGIFDDIVNKISIFIPYRNAISKGNKCVKLSLSNKQIDIVPAVRSAGAGGQFNEPIDIFSRNTQASVKNYPKSHYARGCEKNKNTNQKYKKCVRLIKNFVNNHNIKKLAPSFPLECLIYSYNDTSFSSELILSFQGIVRHICLGQNFNVNFSTIAGDRAVVSSSGWPQADFENFRHFLNNKLAYLDSAINANNQIQADYYFKQFFGMK